MADSTKGTKNTHFSDLNETRMGYILNGNKWTGSLSAAQATHDLKNSLTSGFSESEKTRAIGQAEAMASAFITWAQAKGYSGIKDVHWTARSGFSFTDIDSRWEEVSKNHPADLLIEFSRGPNPKSPSGNFLGVSMKAIKKKTGEAPVKTPGVKKIAKFAGLDENHFSNIIKEGVNNISAKGITKGKTLLVKDEVKKIMEKISSTNVDDAIEKAKAEYIQREKVRCLSKCRDDLLKGFQTQGDGDVMLYILSDLLDTDKIPRYVKVTGRGGANSNWTASVDDPVSNTKFLALMNDTLNFAYETAGGDSGFSFGVKKGDKRIIKIRFKFESTPFASALKMSIEPWTGTAKAKEETVISE